MDKKDKIDYIESMKILRCKPGDIVVLKTNRILDAEIANHIENIIQKVVNNKCLILEDGMDIGVLRNDRIEKNNKGAKNG